MPIDQSQLTITQLRQLPALLQSKIDDYQDQLKHHPKQYRATFNQYLNLRVLQLFDQIDQLDNVIDHYLILHTQQCYDHQIDIDHPINFAFLNALKVINQTVLSPIKILDQIINDPNQAMGNIFNFDMTLVKDLDDNQLPLASLNQKNLNELHHVKIRFNGPHANWMLGGFIQKMVLLRHLQQYLKRHLYRQWRQTTINPLDQNWHQYFKMQSQNQVQHQVMMATADQQRYDDLMDLIDTSFSYHTGTLMTDWE